MKKQKLNLEKLKVDSFVTKQNVKAGHGSSYYIGYYMAVAIDYAANFSNDCPGDTDWSCGSDCSMSA